MKADNDRRIPTWAWIVGAVLALVLCLCLVAAALVVGNFVIFERVIREQPSLTLEVVTVPVATVPVIPSDTPSPTETEPAVTPEDTATGEPGETATPTPETDTARGDTPENAALRAQLEENVSEIRGLEPTEPVVTTLLSREELRQRVEEDLFADLTEEEARELSLVLYSFDFVPRDFDYYNFTLDLYSEQVAGFYDSETDEFVVVSDDDELDVLEQWTHVHEFMHALQDQHFTLDRLDDEDLDSEAAAALLALIEGEAVLIQNLYLLQGYFTFEELNEIFALSTEIESPVLDSAPPVLANNLAFPYTAGFDFVQTLYEQGGFDAINDAWSDPPVSTEHILHPDRYLAGDLPQIVSLAPLTDTLGTGWQQIDEDIFGEFFLREYLAQQLGSSQVDVAATGWGGDRYTVYYNETDDALVAVLAAAWDAPADADEFAAAIGEYNTARYGASGRVETDGGLCWENSDVTCFYRLGGLSYVIIGPDLQTVQSVAAAQE